MIPEKLNNYELLSLLGEGGIGQVFAARDTVLGRQVAIKMLRPELSRDKSFISRFYTEAQSLGDLNHPNITTLYALHPEGEKPFMAMELVSGFTIEALLARTNRLPLRESLAVIAQGIAGLSYAHRRGIIHRDIKPANLMINDSGLLKIMDFGIARVRGTQRQTRAGLMFGTLFYTSPEQIKGAEGDERSDLYSLALVLYEMLVGTPPFTGDTDHALMTAHLEAPPPPLGFHVRGVAAEVEPALMRALSKDPKDRFGSVEEFGQAVGAAAIRGEAVDILERCYTASFQEAAPATRLINTGGALAPSAMPIEAVKGAVRVASTPARSALPPGMTRTVRRPLIALGGALGLVAAGLAYLAFGLPSTGSRDHAADAPTQSVPQPLPQAATTPAQAGVAPPKAVAPSPPPSASPPQAPAETPTPPPAAAALPTAAPVPPAQAGSGSEAVAPSPPAGTAGAGLTATEPPTVVASTGDAASGSVDPKIQGIVTEVPNAATLVIEKQTIRLAGIELGPAKTANTRSTIQALANFKAWIQKQGVIQCEPTAAADRYRCFNDRNMDVAETGLLNGAGIAENDANEQFRAFEEDARKNYRGVWGR